MKRLFPVAVLAPLLLLIVESQIHSQTIGELGLTIGGIYPQGNYVKYAEPGFNATIRGNFRISGFEATSIWVDFNFSEFSRQTTDIDIIAGSFIVPGVQTISEQAFSFHTGLQLGSQTRRGFFRPRAAIGPGLFIFTTKTSVKQEGATEDLASDADTQVKFGWRGVVGAEFFFTTKWGITVEFLYDHVLNLNRTLEFDQATNALVRTGQAARFNSYMIGVVFPFLD